MPHPARPRENLFANLICNLAIPTLILTQLNGDAYLGPKVSLVVALAFPLGYGIYDFVLRRRANFISIVGFLSVLCTGGLGLLNASALWFAIKDAAFPALIALAVLVSLRSKTPIIRELIYNDQIIDVDRVDSALAGRGQAGAFTALLAKASRWLAVSFLASAVISFFLARYLLKSAPGTPQFTAELGRMHALSWPIVALPSMAVMMWVAWDLIKGLSRLTGLTIDEILHGGKPAPKPQ